MIQDMNLSEWIWPPRHSPGATQIVDLYHAPATPLGVGSQTVTPRTSPTRTAAHRDLLDEGKIEELMSSFQSLETFHTRLAEKIRTETEYCEEHPKRMRYPDFSPSVPVCRYGGMEARCKTVIRSRCSQSGTLWTRRGANAILALRCSQFNERFEDY
jgi:hypothetical protein